MWWHLVKRGDWKNERCYFSAFFFFLIFLVLIFICGVGEPHDFRSRHKVFGGFFALGMVIAMQVAALS